MTEQQGSVLTAGSDWTVREVTALKALLLGAANSAGTVCLDASGVERADTAGVQLLVALNQTLRARGAELLLKAPSGALCAALDRVGLGRAIRRVP